MNLSNYIVPTCYAVLFHGLVAGMLLMNWEDDERINISEVEPYYIEATVVRENPHKAQERKESAEAAALERAARQRAAREAEEKEKEKNKAAERQARLDAERLKQQVEAQKQREKSERLARAKANEAAAADEEIGKQQAERERMADQLARAVMSEQSARKAVTDHEKAMAYAAQIRHEIVQQWSRPPSARNNMQALLKVSLVPTGEVVDVTVLEGSGNEAFDRSAVLAVEKAERFVVPDDSSQFERNFREFEVLFRPEDLRL
ncbi:MAG: cell envelope integrity protein TolA [Gammaproteobacteria bacterium]|nr:cell envelope integrity protein TolA [Gammaproteobacteria bacterium]